MLPKKRTGRDLGEKRGECEVVLTIDQRDARVAVDQLGAGQVRSRVKPPKAPTDDDDSGAGLGHQKRQREGRKDLPVVHEHGADRRDHGHEDDAHELGTEAPRHNDAIFLEVRLLLRAPVQEEPINQQQQERQGHLESQPAAHGTAEAGDVPEKKPSLSPATMEIATVITPAQVFVRAKR